MHGELRAGARGGVDGDLQIAAGLAEAAQREHVLALPGGALGRAQLRRAVVARAEATALAAGRREAAQLAVLVHGVAEPVDAGAATDGIVSHSAKGEAVE